jgi:hypothetical protein
LLKNRHPFVDKQTLYIYTCKCIFMHTERGRRPRSDFAARNGRKKPDCLSSGGNEKET